jgi:hypothetical protein
MIDLLVNLLDVVLEMSDRAQGRGHDAVDRVLAILRQPVSMPSGLP